VPNIRIISLLTLINNRKLKIGDNFAINGTDIIEFDACSGRIAQLWSSQDSLNYAHLMGQTITG
jgi:hypothetical protein